MDTKPDIDGQETQEWIEALDSVIDRFENSLPPDVRTSISEFTRYQSALAGIEDLREISTKWSGNDVSYPNDWNKVFDYLKTKLALPDADIGQIQTQLNQLINDAKKKRSISLGRSLIHKIIFIFLVKRN